MKSPITTHVLDTSLGCPAAGVSIRLYFEDAPDHWLILSTGITDDDGRIMNLLPADHQLKTGKYRMRFNTDDYFRHLDTESFYPSVDVVFVVRKTGGHFHVPLLLNPFGYSTYRGS